MTEAFTLTLEPDEGWRLLGSTPEKSDVEVVLRSFDADVQFATGKTKDAPDSPPLVVRAVEGGRLTGLHFFARPTPLGAARRILVRGV